MDLTRLREALDRLYERYNRRRFVPPDPLQFLYPYEDPSDRELVGMIAASLAFGNVNQIVRAVAAVLERMPQPACFLEHATGRSLRRAFWDYRYRFVTGDELALLLYALKRAREHYGSLQACFQSGLGNNDKSIQDALTVFVAKLRALGKGFRDFLLPSPADGSACKRLNLYLRWMVRRDKVDPGGWHKVSPAQLLVPVDAHIHRCALRLGLTQRCRADFRTVLEITAAFRRIVPKDPVRYDFALTRLGIRKDATSLKLAEQLEADTLNQVGGLTAVN